MKDPVDRAVRAIARRQPFALLWAQFSVTHLVMLGGMGILRLYQPMSAAHFWLLVALSQVLVGIDNVIAAKLTYKLLRPVRAWLRGSRDERSTIAAWRALVALPLDLLRRLRSLPLLFLYFPFIAFTTWLLELPWYSFLLLSVVGSAVLAYGLISATSRWRSPCARCSSASPPSCRATARSTRRRSRYASDCSFAGPGHQRDHRRCGRRSHHEWTPREAV